MAACPHCGGLAHYDAPCEALAPVRHALRFPAAFQLGPGGRRLFVRTLNVSPIRIAFTSFLVAASFGALFASTGAAGLGATALFGFGAAVSLALLGGGSQALEVAPGLLERYGDHGVAGLPMRLTSAEVTGVSARPAPEGFVISAQTAEREVPLLAAVKSKPVAERIAAEVQRVFALEPFVGQRALELGHPDSATTIPKLRGAAVNDDELVIDGRRIGSDEVVALDVVERISATNAAPTYLLELRLRKGEVLRPIATTRRASELIAFVRQLRAHWRL